MRTDSVRSVFPPRIFAGATSVSVFLFFCLSCFEIGIGNLL
jgi:hypothetical protein